MRILVVEDEPALREALRTQLAAAGFTVDIAADGEEGLFAGTEYPMDVAIVDLGLPKIPGSRADPPACARRARASRSWCSPRAIAGRTRSKGLQAGADDYVAKPFHFEEVHGARAGADAPRRRLGQRRSSSAARSRSIRARRP